MKKRIFIFCVICLAFSHVCFARLQDGANIAVMSFANELKIPSDLTFEEGNVVKEYVIQELINSGHFRVIERDGMALQAITDEISLGMTGLIHQDQIIKIGHQQGAQYMIFGSISGLSAKTIGKNSARSISDYQVIAYVTFRVIDTETGQVILAGNGEGKSNLSIHDDYVAMFRIGETKVSYDQVHDALMEAAVDAVRGKRGLLALSGRT